MPINEELELNNINTNLIISEDDTEYCCICINTIEDEFIKLKCCNQSIHENCIIEYIININNDIYKCPICRNQMQLYEPITFGKIIDYINDKQELISNDKVKSIIKNLYKDIPITVLFNTNENENEEIRQLNYTIQQLTIKNDKMRVMFLFISLPLVVMITIFVFNNYK